jgi:hypothetical protein
VRTLLVILGLLLLPATAGATNSFGKSAHSHFDVHPYQDHEVTFCYEVIDKATGAGSEIANFPMRIQDGQNNYELRIRTDGLQFVRRVGGTATTITSTLPNPHLVFGPGSDVMFDVTLIGSSITAYDFTGNVRGPALYHWTDTKWPTGKAFSYYTIGGWHGLWEVVHGRPLDQVGSTHDVFDIEQDARAHPQGSSASTFDSPIPGGGGEGNLITDATAGVASGENYTYTLSVTAGSGTFDVRDPGTQFDTVFFQAGYTRLTPGTTSATLKRYTGSGTLVETRTAPFGGAGSYTLHFQGGTATLTKAGMSGSLVTTGNNVSGLRVRTHPGTGQSITWQGLPDGVTAPVVTPPPSAPATGTKTKSSSLTRAARLGGKTASSQSPR